LDKIERLWKQNPDMRLGQLLINHAGFHDAFQIWEKEDSETEEHLNVSLSRQNNFGRKK